MHTLGIYKYILLNNCELVITKVTMSIPAIKKC